MAVRRINVIHALLTQQKNQVSQYFLYPHEKWQEGRHRDRRENEPAPDPGGGERQSPTTQQCKDAGRCRQRPA